MVRKTAIKLTKAGARDKRRKPPIKMFLDEIESAAPEATKLMHDMIKDRTLSEHKLAPNAPRTYTVTEEQMTRLIILALNAASNNFYAAHHAELADLVLGIMGS